MIDFDKLPRQPGIYKFLNKKEQIIYIGKAKNIKTRVMQYFKVGSHKSEYFKSLIFRVDYVLTSSETEALLLEINLIKTHKPKFNIIFKDDKTYPFICVLEKEGNTKVEARRSKRSRLKNCFGPFPAGTKPFQMTRAISQLYKLRKCHKRESRCIYAQLDQCLHLQGKEKLEYNQKVKKDIISFFKGKNNSLKEFALKKMEHFSRLQEYEKAQKYKNIIERIDVFHENQTVYFEQIEKADYIGHAYFEQSLAIFIIHVREGKIVNTFSKKYDVVGDLNESLKNFIISFYETYPQPETLYLTTKIEKGIDKVLSTKISYPQIGKKRKLLDMANSNAAELMNSVIKSQNKRDSFELEWLKLAKFVNIIDLVNLEIYDASHTFGQNYVGAKVEFEYGKYNAEKTRKYDLSSLNSSNDALAIDLMIQKRFKNNKEIPDLIVVDGGRAQINSALKALYASGIKIKVIGLVKNQNHKTEAIINTDGIKYNIKDIEFKNLLKKMQEQIHKVAINYHKFKRQKELQKNNPK